MFSEKNFGALSNSYNFAPVKQTKGVGNDFPRKKTKTDKQ
jgi:hypothetical protein